MFGTGAAAAAGLLVDQNIIMGSNVIVTKRQRRVENNNPFGKSWQWPLILNCCTYRQLAYVWQWHLLRSCSVRFNAQLLLLPQLLYYDASSLFSSPR